MIRLAKRRKERERIAEVARKLKVERVKALTALSAIKAKRERAEEKMRFLFSRGEAERAKIYAEAAAYLEALERVLSNFEALLYVVAERLDTIIVVMDAAAGIRSVVEHVAKIRDRLASIMPLISDTLSELAEQYSELVSVVQPSYEGIVIAPRSLDAEEILAQATSIATEITPPPPIVVSALREHSGDLVKAAEAALVKIVADGGARAVPSVASAVLSHVRKSGAIDPEECASKLGLPLSDVISALCFLTREGLL